MSYARSTLPEAAPTQGVILQVGGMTCASCAARVERTLNRIPGVDASVNYATATAHVRHAESLDPGTLVAAVEASGYTAALPPGAGDGSVDGWSVEVVRSASGARRLVVSALLTIPVVVLAMVRPWQFDGWQWVSFALAVPVVSWCAWPFHRAAWAHARHSAATMDTLISLGVLAAFGWSTYALVLGQAGEIGMQMPFAWVPGESSGSSEIYFEVATGVTTLILAGRFLEGLAARRSGAALRALLELGAKDVAVIETTPDGSLETRVPIERLRVGDVFVVRPGEKVATDGQVVEGSSAVDLSLLTGEPAPGGRVAWDRGHWRHPQHVGSFGRPGRAGRCRHRAGADRPPGRAGAGGQGAGPAARGPGVGRLRPGRPRRVPAHPCPVVADGARRGGRVQRCGGCPHHRVPLCARARDADRPARGHRPWRAARRLGQGSRRARVGTPGRHRGARQDRHRDRRPDAGCRRGWPGRRRPATCSGSRPLSRRPPTTPSPGRSRRPAPQSLGCPAPPPSSAREDSAWWRRSKGTSWRPDGVPGSWTRTGMTTTPASPRRPEASKLLGARWSGSGGTGAPAAWSRWPTPSSRPRPRRWACCATSGCGRCCSPATTPEPRRPSLATWGSTPMT